MPPSTPATSAPQLCTGSFHPSPYPGGRCSPARAPSPGHPCRPPLAAASSLLRTDSTLKQKRGLSTPAPTSSRSRTVGGAEPWRGVRSSMRGTPSPLCLSPLLGPWNPLLLGVCPGGPLSLHSLFYSQASSKCLHTYPSRAHLLWMWSARVHAWAHVYVCEVTKPHPGSFPVFKSPALPDEVDN